MGDDEQQRVAGLEHDLAWRLVDALSAAGYGSNHHVVVLLEAGTGDSLTYEAAAVGDVGGA